MRHLWVVEKSQDDGKTWRIRYMQITKTDALWDLRWLRRHNGGYKYRLVKYIPVKK